MNLLPLLIIPFLANIWVHWIFIPLKVKKGIKRRLKPFDCEGCMSMWLTAIWYIRPDYILQGILLAFAAFFIGYFMSRLFTNYLNKYYAKIRYNYKTKG